jgi:hypothetical protein
VYKLKAKNDRLEVGRINIPRGAVLTFRKSAL